jgi:DNA sulfur modification protein DndD
LKFLEIELNNWGPYKGHHRLDLDTNDKSPIVLIFGENGKGKTSLAKGILWCLFGSISKINGSQFANWNAINDGKSFPVSIRVKFSIEESYADKISNEQRNNVTVFEITRSFDAKKDERAHLRILPINEQVTLLRDGELQDKNLIDTWIQRYLPFEMSRFFLFDGEELSKINYDLEEGESNSIKASIESVMGIPALQNLDDLIRSEQKKIDKSIKTSRDLEDLTSQLEKVTKSLDLLEVERKRTLESLRAAERESQELQEELLRIDSVQGQIAQKEVYDKRKIEVEADLRRSLDDIKDFFRNNWWVPLNSEIKTSIDREIKGRSSNSQRRSDLQLIQTLKSSINEAMCATCGQTISNFSEIEKRIAELESKLNESGDVTDQVSVGFIERFAKPETIGEELRWLLQDERRNLTQLDEIDGLLKRINAQLANVDIEATKGVLNRYLSKQDTIGRYKASITSTEKRISEEKNNENVIRKKISLLGGLPENLERRSVVLQQIRGLVASLKESFSDKVREEVQMRASENYVEMMQNDDLIGLEIDENFKVTAKHKSLGRKLANSKGQSLIAVYAFVGALIDVSGNDGAWLIDTVGSRLDKDKMASVWQWLASRNRQVIAMPHSNELDKDDASKLLGSSISLRYEIVSSNSSDADSRFVRVGD